MVRDDTAQRQRTGVDAALPFPYSWSAVYYQNLLPVYMGSSFLRPLERIHETLQVLPDECDTGPFGAWWLILQADGPFSFLSNFATTLAWGSFQGVAVAPPCMIAARYLYKGVQPPDDAKAPAETAEDKQERWFLSTGAWSLIELNLVATAMYPVENALSVYLLASARYALGQGYEFTGVIDALLKLYRRYGLLGGLYGGLGARLLHLNLQFSLGYLFLDVADARDTVDTQRTIYDGGGGVTLGEKCPEAEALAALLAAGVTYPLFGALGRLRRGWVVPQLPEYDGVVDVLTKVIDTEGVTGLFSGVSWFLVRRAALFLVCKTWPYFVYGG